ncbi:unnamed protein product [Clonostachys rhizophaga]|uniref:BZIP domain-containing protein n=1 Tax=Clonostachys rhizophaga TaxID=160324 RepID=A0A9N9VRC8_9HYPO|nr:unnamed protein product [Clonostachys rhizophaga]
MVDPRLAIPLHDFLNKPQKPTFAISPSIWDQQLNTSIPLLGDQIDLDNSTEAKDDGDVEMIGLCSSHAAGIKTSSRALSNSSIPSLTSSSLSQSSHQTKKQARKPKIKKRQQQLNQDLVRDVSRTKRKQYLERNRIAVSKYRQKKKDWTHELEETNRSMMRLESLYNSRRVALLMGWEIIPLDIIPLEFFPSITIDTLNPLINTTLSTDINDNSLPCDVCILPTQTTNNLQLNQGIWPQEPSPRNPSVEQANINILQEGPKPTVSKIQRKDLGKDEEINEY